MLRKTVLATATVVAVLGGGAVALAASGGNSGSPAAGRSAALSGPVYHGCVTAPHGRVIDSVLANRVPKCPRGSWPIRWNARGPAGPAGPAGLPGERGPSGVVSTGNTSLISAPESILTGGSFTARKTLLGTIHLRAGTYLLNVNFMATPNAVTSGAVFPSLYVYNGPQKPDFSNDMFNVGSGALQQLAVLKPNVIDSYFSGSGELTVPRGGEMLNIYAFGYDSDGGPGSYKLDNAVVIVTALHTR